MQNEETIEKDDKTLVAEKPSKADEFENYLTKARKDNSWREGSEWADAERYVHDQILEKARKLKGSVCETDAEALAEAVKMHFNGKRYYGLNHI